MKPATSTKTLPLNNNKNDPVPKGTASGASTARDIKQKPGAKPTNPKDKVNSKESPSKSVK